MIHELIAGILTISIVIGMISNIIFAWRLYKDAPEKNSMGFNKYLNTLMMDVSPFDKSLLVYEGDRLKIFLQFRKIILSILCISAGCLIISIVLKVISE
ncbi:hypothetical protein [Cellvibrio sp. NN19]|uniref:hypothetical protein n=1 Tax=Cellvibrio chitinivorans TaxID=3102792 RepID=UPI002B416C2A|nr:hypothetical protein [Cellvibrio sp. NN19]